MDSDLKFIISILFFKPRIIVGSNKVIGATSSGPAASSVSYTSAVGVATVYTPPTQPPAAIITPDPYVYRSEQSIEKKEWETNYPQPTPDSYGFRSEQHIGDYPPPPPY